MVNLLVVVDYQNDFVNGALGFAGAEKLESGIATAVQETLDANGYVLFTRDTHPQEYLHTREGEFLPIPHCIKGSHGHQLYASLHHYEVSANPNVLVIDKESFGLGNIGEIARQLCKDEPDDVKMCGIVTDICVISNAIILHSQLPNAKISVISRLCGSANSNNSACAGTILNGLGIKF